MNPIHVLLVEDNPADVALARASLESSKLKLSMHVAEDGVEALRFLRREEGFTEVPRPDLILLDLNLPKLDGREVLDACKQDPDLRRIPVVVLTSSKAETDILKSYDLGANSYVTKPIGLKEFQKIVRAIEDFWFTVVHLPGK